MACIRVELLVLLTRTLLLVSSSEWERIDGTQLLSSYESGKVDASTPDVVGDYDEDDVSEDVSEVEGVVTSDGFDPFADHGFQVENAAPSGWDSETDGFMEEYEAPPRSGSMGAIRPSSAGLSVVCNEASFQITLQSGSISDMKVLGSKHLLPVMEAPESCGYEVNLFQNTLTVPFSGCHVTHSDRYSLQMLYVNDFGQTQVASAFCDGTEEIKPAQFPRSSSTAESGSRCSSPTTTPTTAVPSKAQNCNVPSGEQVTCGPSGTSTSECEAKGCCVDPSTSACFYPMDECTSDQHFVFAIRSNAGPIKIDPMQLVFPGSQCKPVIVNEQVAIFKFKVTECGTRFYEVGNTKIYLAEVQTAVKALNLKYGAITRTDSVRFMVECRYSKTGHSPTQSLASVGYMVKTPDIGLPSSVKANGLYAVQLRIATDQTYSNYLPTYHQPLRLLLGKPVYLELRLKSPKPDAVVLVNYCLAYPRSAKNALVLVYKGCANPHDPHVSILQVSDLPKNRNQRRFVVKAFQFMDQKTNLYLDEEIYFMCSAEVCRPAEKTCEERCFDGKAP